MIQRNRQTGTALCAKEREKKPPARDNTKKLKVTNAANPIPMQCKLEICPSPTTLKRQVKENSSTEEIEPLN